MLKEKVSYWSDAIVNSYSQLFFSDNKVFAYLLLVSTFVDPYVGISGMFALIVTLLFTHWLGFSPVYFRSGAYSYNSLMVGLVMGIYFKFNIPFFVVLAFISFLTLLFTILIAQLLAKYSIPALSLPFILGLWTLLLSVKNLGAINLNERGIYTINELYSYGGNSLVYWSGWLNSLSIPPVIDIYLKSLGAVFFQYNLLAGVLIMIGLIVYSRIAFLLSVIGFVTGYLFYTFLNSSYTPLQYSYIGFNFILTAIAMGGFFMIPSKKSFLLVLLITPVIALLLLAFTYALSIYQLPVYSLPFNVTVILLLFVLNLRLYPNRLDRVTVQQFSPEKNLYRHYNQMERFNNDTYFHIHLPFFGERFVSQGYNGNITHKGDWQHALDFVVKDDEGKTYHSSGTDVKDYYCYDLPVLAPAAGYVTTLVDGVEDNIIGGVDLEQNWGNALVIKHSEFLYSKLTHLRKGSFKVKLHDYVQKGEVVAACGNSGRSPEPHIHFQMQTTPFIGSKTLAHPISYYIEKKDGEFFFRSFMIPKEGEYVQRVETTRLLKEAFSFIPGKVMNFLVTEKGKEKKMKWEIFVNSYNQSYIYCHNTGSTAYLTNNGTVHYFYDFYGDNSSLLYYFYLGAHKQLLGYYPDLEVTDHLPIEGFYKGAKKVLQDFISPFHIFLKTNYRSKFISVDDVYHPARIEITGEAVAKTGNHIDRKIEMRMLLQDNRIQSFIFREKSKTIIAECID